ncbi:MAG: ComF family protein [Thermoleophilia bacterium]|nr:ComF family protein [Thermoleophilia bacterium]
MGRIATAILDSLIGDGCAACGMPGPPLCAPCADAIAPLGPAACTGCGHPWPVPCAACGQCIPGVAWARQAAPYRYPVPDLVSAVKDLHRRALAPLLADVMVRRIAPPPPGAVLVPVPLAPRRLAERGFNQADLLAQRLADAWGVPMQPVLSRPDGAPAQRGAGAPARRRQVQGAFRAVRPAPLHAVLVDDVVTTGSTLSAAARALRTAGCARVGAVSLARVAPVA